MTNEKKQNEEKNELDLNWAKLPKAKRSRLLDQVSARLRGCHKQDTFEVFGTWYTLRTLDSPAESWTLRFVEDGTVYAVAKTKRAPTVAAAIVAVGEAPDKMVPIEELFQLPDNVEAVPRQLIESSAAFEADWRRTEVLRWLSEPDGHEYVVAALYDKYLSLEKARNEALVALSPLSKKTPTGESSTTSSPERVSSSAIPASPG